MPASFPGKLNAYIQGKYESINYCNNWSFERCQFFEFPTSASHRHYPWPCWHCLISRKNWNTSAVRYESENENRKAIKELMQWGSPSASLSSSSSSPSPSFSSSLPSYKMLINEYKIFSLSNYLFIAWDAINANYFSQ